MHKGIRVLTGAAAFIIAALAVAGGWIYLAPPDLLRVGSGYAAKIVCSNAFLAGRPAQEVLAVDVQAPGHPLLKLMRVSVDEARGRVHAALLGFIAANEAVYHEGLGCTVVPDVARPPSQTKGHQVAAELRYPAPWPDGEDVEPDPAIAALLSDAALTGPGMRAVIVVKGGRIVGEAYGEGVSRETPLLGWSMTKTVTAAIVGTLIRDGKLSLEDRSLMPQWRDDKRAEISLADLLAMESGLTFNDDYGTVADVTRMLFLETDMAGFAADQPLESPPGSRFTYSSGTGVLLSRIWMDRVGDPFALEYPRKALFDPIGMTSAVLETDASGTFVGGSYMYATARDWARFGLLLARNGVWNGRQVVPSNFVKRMGDPNRTSGGRYSQAQTWLPRADAGLPPDTFILDGHDGQNIIVVPSEDLVLVRLGLTPRWQGYSPIELARAILQAKDRIAVW